MQRQRAGCWPHLRGQQWRGTRNHTLEHALCKLDLTEGCAPCMQVHAEGEAEHAALGHAAVASFVPAAHVGLLRRAMHDHDRDFAAFYNHLADLLEAVDCYWLNACTAIYSHSCRTLLHSDE